MLGQITSARVDNLVKDFFETIGIWHEELIQNFCILHELNCEVFRQVLFSGGYLWPEEAFLDGLKRDLPDAILEILSLGHEHDGRLDKAQDALDGHTPLTWLVVRGDVERVQCLLRLGADHSLLNRSAKTPLELACTQPNPALLRVLLERTPNFLDANPIRTLFSLAVVYDQVEVARVLASFLQSQGEVASHRLWNAAVMEWLKQAIHAQNNAFCEFLIETFLSSGNIVKEALLQWLKWAAEAGNVALFRQLWKRHTFNWTATEIQTLGLAMLSGGEQAFLQSVDFQVFWQTLRQYPNTLYAWQAAITGCKQGLRILQIASQAQLLPPIIVIREGEINLSAAYISLLFFSAHAGSLPAYVWLWSCLPFNLCRDNGLWRQAFWRPLFDAILRGENPTILRHYLQVLRTVGGAISSHNFFKIRLHEGLQLAIHSPGMVSVFLEYLNESPSFIEKMFLRGKLETAFLWGDWNLLEKFLNYVNAQTEVWDSTDYCRAFAAVVSKRVGTPAEWMSLYQRLSARGVNLRAEFSFNGAIKLNLFGVALASGALEWVSYLLDLGIDPHQSVSGVSSVEFAQSHGHVGIARLLLRRATNGEKQFSFWKNYPEGFEVEEREDSKKLEL